MTAETVVLQRAEVIPVLRKLLVRKGMFAAEADLVLDRLFDAEQHGLHEFGIAALPALLEAFDLGDIDPRARLLTVEDFPAGAVLDGSSGAGHVAGSRAVAMAVAKAKEAGIASIAVRDSRPWGAAQVYALLGARAGMVAWVVSSSGRANVLSAGAEHPLMGNQPLAIGIPTRDGNGWASQVLTAQSTADAGGMPPELLQPIHDLWGTRLSLMLGGVVAGLTGGRLPIHKRKRSVFSESAEHVCLLMDPVKFGCREKLFDEWDAAAERWAATHPDFFEKRDDSAGISVPRASIEPFAALLVPPMP